MGSIGNVQTTSSLIGGHMTEAAFNEEVQRQDYIIDAEVLYEYVASSYGGISMGDRISDFIDNASDKIKYGKGTIYRGLMFSSKKEFDTFIKQHQVGDIIKTRRDGLSWSSDKTVAEEFSTMGAYSIMMVNNDSHKNAIGIENVADTPIPSREVLYSNKVDFKVTKVEKQGNHAVIYVTENKRRKK